MSRLLLEIVSRVPNDSVDDNRKEGQEIEENKPLLVPLNSNQGRHQKKEAHDKPPPCKQEFKRYEGVL